MLLWAFFLALAFGGVGQVYGIHYLFLDPEYLNKVDFLSFFIVGLTLGNFIMAYQITSYILDGHRFTFLGVLEKPFGKYCLNNGIIPLIAVLTYMIGVFVFQIKNQGAQLSQGFLYVAGILSGTLIMLTMMFMYFRFTNRDIFKYLAGSLDRKLRRSGLSRDRMMYKYNESKRKEYNVDYYFDLKLRFRNCKAFHDFHDKETILKVFDQNHFNSVLFELIIIILVFVLGIFIDYPIVQIPAAASTLLLLSIIIMFVGAISYWFRGWGVALIFGLFILANIISSNGLIKNVNPAKGLDYDSDPVQYSLQNLSSLSTRENFENDKMEMVHALDHWKENQNSEKPKIVFLCVSGGGQRAALWTLHVIQKSDSILNGSLLNKTFMISGASGGMIGAAYYRELYLRKKLGQEIDLQSTEWIQNMGKDNLNSIIFSLVVNDSFFKIRRVEYEDQVYFKDRGFVFENNLNRNINGVLDKKLSDYRSYEQTADIPILMMSPVISNDGRKLYVSASPISFMTISQPGFDTDFSNQKIRGVDFNRMFASHGSENLSFLSALRMSASFPYITPTISLPSDPRIEVMDAGIADNFGIQDALRFIFVMKEWIEENTSGVVLAIIRDSKKIAPIENRPYPSIVDRFTYPISSVYNNLANIQDIHNDNEIENLRSWIETPINVLEFEYDTYTIFEGINFVFEGQKNVKQQIERASLSWHLTSKEKRNILRNIDFEENQNTLKELGEIFSSNYPDTK